MSEPMGVGSTRTKERPSNSVDKYNNERQHVKIYCLQSINEFKQAAQILTGEGDVCVDIGCRAHGVGEILTANCDHTFRIVGSTTMSSVCSPKRLGLRPDDPNRVSDIIATDNNEDNSSILAAASESAVHSIEQIRKAKNMPEVSVIFIDCATATACKEGFDVIDFVAQLETMFLSKSLKAIVVRAFRVANVCSRIHTTVETKQQKQNKKGIEQIHNDKKSVSDINSTGNSFSRGRVNSDGSLSVIHNNDFEDETKWFYLSIFLGGLLLATFFPKK